MKNRYLLTGASGKLGSELKSKFLCDAPSRQQLDVRNKAQVDNWLKEKSYRAVVHLAAISDRNYATTHKREAYLTNVVGTRHIATSAAKYSLKVFYISTDYVFDCQRGNYLEEDEPNPQNWYGFTKLAGELEIKLALKNHCIIRTSFRPSNWPFETAYNNVSTSADYTDIIANEIALAINYDLEGLIHIGTEKKTLYDLAIRRNPQIKAETCLDPAFPKRRSFNLKKWSKIKHQHENSSS